MICARDASTLPLDEVLAGGGDLTAVVGPEVVGIVVGLGSATASMKRGTACETGSGAATRAVVGKVGFGSGFAVGVGRTVGLEISSKLEVSSASSSTSSSLSWNLDAMAAIDPFCSDIVGGGAL